MHFIHLESVDSTQTFAKDHFPSFPRDELICITAEEQTAGQARQGRSWVSSKVGNLYCTLYFTLSPHFPHITAIGQVFAVSFSKWLEKNGLIPKIKWPNDVQLHGKKLAGILCELKIESKETHVFLGFGINVNAPDSFLKDLPQPATSLATETKHPWDEKKLLLELLDIFRKDLNMFQKEGFGSFQNFCNEHLAYKGEKISCFDGKKTWIGLCHSFAEDGQLNLLLPDQTIKKFSSADIL